MFCFTLLFSLLTACKNQNNADEVIVYENDFYFYPIDEEFKCFSVDQNGILYYLVEEIIEKETEQGSSYTLSSVDLEGNQLDSYSLGEGIGISNLTVNDQKAYFTELQADSMNQIRIMEFSFDTQITREICTLPQISMVKLEVIDDKLFYLGNNIEMSGEEEYRISNQNEYHHTEKVVGKIDIKDGSNIELAIDFPIAFAKTEDENLMIYAYDEEGGYYFTQYHIKDENYSKKTYHDLGNLGGFAICNDNKSVIYNSYSSPIICLAASIIGSEDEISELMPYTMKNNYFEISNDIVSIGDYTYYKNGNRIERIRTMAYLRGIKTIHMISTETKSDSPFSCGYTIKRDYLDAESFALSVLSHDDNFDICLMSSRQNISENIRNKGAFYPLNEVAGVKEYLDACFPYIKEAATTPEGDIWMLPIEIDIPCLIYNEELCKANGMDLSVPRDIYSFMNLINELQNNKDLDVYYSLSKYLLAENLIHQYLRGSKDLNTDLFKELAPYIKENINYLPWENGLIVNSQAASDGLHSDELQNFLFQNEYYSDSIYKYAKQYDIRISAFPKLPQNNTNIATCLYLSVNPYSKNLKETLKYVSVLCNYVYNNKATMLFQDRNKYPDQQAFDDLYQIFSQGEIVFNLPTEVYVEDFGKYLTGEIDLLALIQEVNRKIDTFLKE